jgi:hypothetical protein
MEIVEKIRLVASLYRGLGMEYSVRGESGLANSRLLTTLYGP